MSHTLPLSVPHHLQDVPGAMSTSLPALGPDEAPFGWQELLILP